MLGVAAILDSADHAGSEEGGLDPSAAGGGGRRHRRWGVPTLMAPRENAPRRGSSISKTHKRCAPLPEKYLSCGRRPFALTPLPPRQPSCRRCWRPRARHRAASCPTTDATRRPRGPCDACPPTLPTWSVWARRSSNSPTHAPSDAQTDQHPPHPPNPNPSRRSSRCRRCLPR